MTEVEISDLLLKYNDGTINAEEKKAFLQWVSICSLDDFTRLLHASPAVKRDLLSGTMTDLRRQRLENALDQIEQTDSMVMPIANNLPPDFSVEERASYKVIKLPFSRRSAWVAASVILLLMSSAALWLRSTHDKQKPNAVADRNIPKDILPGHDGAILTLSDGRQVVLDSMANGAVTSEKGSSAVLEDGKLVYNLSRNGTAQVAFHEMSTPNGRQFRLKLPDGTGVWLNAASSIKYPTIFTGNERRVEVTGEVYFEVTKDPKRSFIVSVNNKMDITVLGTHFNVNAYGDESMIHTTLLEGSVKIKDNGKTAVLSPGMQAMVNNHSLQEKGIQVVKDVDIDMIMAWKNGFFSFRQTDITAVMRQISRWYDMEVVYTGNVPDRKFGGSISRKDNLQEVLKMMEEMKVRYRIEGKKIIIMG